MIAGQTRLEYYLILGLDIVVVYFGLLCAGYFVAAAAFGGVPGIAHPFSIAVECLAAIELLWFLLWFLPYQARVQRETTAAWSLVKPEPLTREERAAFYQKCLSLAPDVEVFLRKWLQNAHMDDIRRENIKDWLLWGLFDRDGPPGEDNEELESYVRMTEERIGVVFKPGRGDCKAIRLSSDEVHMSHRSLFYYYIIGLIDFFTTVRMYLLGFSFYRQRRSKFFTTFPFRPMGLLAWNESAAGEHMSYFVRPHKSTTHRPVLFIHGIGVGLFPYLQYFSTIPQDVGVVAVELLPIASRLCSPMPRVSELVSSIAAILEQQGPPFNDIVVVSNSYGTFLTAPLLLSPRVAPKISSLVLVDPVAFLLHLPEVAYNFTRRMPKKHHGNECQMRLVARDPGIAHSLARRFSWREYILWRELLLAPPDPSAARLRTTVIVGERDCIINAPAVASYVAYDTAMYTSADIITFASSEKRWTGARPLELVWLPGEDHGCAFMKRHVLPSVTRVVNRYCDKRDGDGISQEGVAGGEGGGRYTAMSMGSIV